MKVKINQDIPGLRKKKKAFSTKPSNTRWFSSFISYERNGYINVGLSRNWTRLAFPVLPLFFFVYMWEPLIHGHIYIHHFNNYQWETVYFKFGSTRPTYTDNTITRLA